jgi:hypothetical protein
MTFEEFAKKYKLTPDEINLAYEYLLFLRLRPYLNELRSVVYNINRAITGKK